MLVRRGSDIGADGCFGHLQRVLRDSEALSTDLSQLHPVETALILHLVILQI